ncbi:MAG: hypothetical protein JWO94_2921 [Verrucomicrobiaceae bacterium]|nr:hypothetical protein [Verrucomicrobiaceae bacterium]
MPEASQINQRFFNCRLATRFCAMAVGVIGAAALAGWVFGIPALTRLHPSLVTMKANMALCLMLAGVALWLLQDEPASKARRRVGQGCAAFMVITGLLTLVEHLWQVDLGIDMLLVHETQLQAGRSLPGRFGPASAVVLTLLGTGLLLMDFRSRRGRHPTPYLVGAAGCGTFFICLSYLYGAGSQTPLSHYLTIGMHTVAAFLLLCLGILAARPRRSLTATCLSPYVGGTLARRLIPAAILLPAFLGWLRILGQNKGWYDAGLGTAAFASALIAIFTFLVARTARSLNHAEALRRIEEENLKLREQELADSFQNAALGMHWVGHDGTILRVNAAELNMLGYREDEYVGRHIAEFHADQEVIEDILHRLKSGEVLMDHPARLRARDGTIRDVLIHSSVYVKDGQFIHTRCFTRDVTELKRVTGELKQSEQRYRSLVELSPEAVIVNQDEKIVFANPAALKLLGSTIVGTPPMQRIQPSFHARVRERIALMLKKEAPAPTLMEKWIHQDGHLMDVEVSAVAINWEGRPAIHVVLRDVSERAEAEDRFRMLAEVVSLQVWTAGLDGGLVFANQECVDYFGTGLEEILGTAWAQFVHPDDLPLALKSWQQSLATGDRYEVEFRLREKDGSYRWFLVRAAPMLDGEGRMTKWFGTNTEIHDLKTAQSEAERASHAKDEFLATLSHELRTPLTPVLMMSAALRDDERIPQDVREQLGMVERNIALEARLIDDLLDLTSISQGKLRLHTQWCDAHSLISLAIEIVREDAQAKGILLNRDFAAHHSGLNADPARFQQVIWNLLRNAVKFTPRGGRITIRTRDEGADHLCIEVSDSGIGIEPEVIDRIFLPFDQGILSGDHRFGGLGLGLSIARTVVDMHGGHISAQSSGLHQGATFTVDLPGAMDPPHGVGQHLPAAGEASSTRPAAGKTMHRVLLVDDHAPTLKVLALLLRRAGHHVVTATSVAEALAAADKEAFDGVISDLGLPDGTGSELMEQLRDQHHLRGIALSGYGMQDDISRSHAAGFDTHLIKPVDFPQLTRALAAWDKPL